MEPELLQRRAPEREPAAVDVADRSIDTGAAERVRVPRVVRAADDADLREVTTHGLDDLERARGFGRGDDEHLGVLGARGLQELRARRVPEVHGQPVVAKNGDDARVEVENRHVEAVCHEQAPGGLAVAPEPGDENRSAA
ncbi:MAG: hypothetical protein AAFP86_20445, partial [Planctomycetota bacterium]